MQSLWLNQEWILAIKSEARADGWIFFPSVVRPGRQHDAIIRLYLLLRREQLDCAISFIPVTYGAENLLISPLKMEGAVTKRTWVGKGGSNR